jgi:hypothetical protein
MNGIGETAHPQAAEGSAASAKSLGLEVDGAIEIAEKIDN